MTHRPAFDPDSANFANDDPTWGELSPQDGADDGAAPWESGPTWCGACASWTNHDTRQHAEAADERGEL